MIYRSLTVINLKKFFFITLCSVLVISSLKAQEKKEKMFQKVIDGLNFPEGPAWDGNGNLYVSSCYGGYITKISGDSSTTFIKASENPFTIKQTNGLTFDKEGNIYACEFGIGAILKILPDGKSEIYASGYEGKRFNKPNDLAFDRNGNLYFTDPNKYDKKDPDGKVYMISAKTKNVKLAADSIAFANGIAFSGDGLYCYVCESAENRVLKFDLNEDGTLGNRSVFVTLPGGDPDGIAFDIKGNLYVAHFGTGHVFVVSPEGKIINELKLPGKKVSNVEFAGKDLKTLYVTEDETNSVYKTTVEIAGLPLFYSPIRNN